MNTKTTNYPFKDGNLPNLKYGNDEIEMAKS